MNRLFIELYLDEDVSVLVAELMRARGFSATTTQEAGRLGASDAEQLAFAVQHGLALLTHNRRDFERLAREYAADHRPHHGIILAIRRSPYEIARRLMLIVNHVTADELRGHVRYI